MSNIIFPAGYTIDLPNLNLEMMQHYAKMWNLKHMKMEKGHFEGSIAAIHTPRIQFATAHYSHSFMSKGDFPDGCVVLIYSTTVATYNFQNQAIDPHEIIMLNKGDEIDILTLGSMSIQTIVIEEQLFNKSLYTFFGELPRTSIQNKRLMLHPDKIKYFHHTISLWKRYLTNELPKLTVSPDYNTIESAILQELFACLVATPSLIRKEKFQSKTIRDLLHKKITQNITISSLTHEFHISKSQLHNTFKNDYGMSPKKYLQNLRLNMIRKELLLGHPHTTTVSQIAQKYNFFHMSHFASEYKKLFGQTPSQTLNSKL